MSISTSVLTELLQALPDLRPQIYFKSSLTALSHAMEDQILVATDDSPLVIASFQRERFYRQEAHRYRRIANRTDQVYILAAPEAEFCNCSDSYETVAFEPTDALAQEWHLVVIGANYASCLVCRERFWAEDIQAKPRKRNSKERSPLAPNLGMDQARRFEGIWTFDREIACIAARLLLDRIATYRPELAEKIQAAQLQYLLGNPATTGGHSTPFVQCLVTYLQAGQYKLLKAYRSIATQERKERLINSITSAIRCTLDPEEILETAVQELGQAMMCSRCLIYRLSPNDPTVTLTHEYLNPNACENPSPAAQGTAWPIAENPLLQTVITGRERLYIGDTQTDERICQASSRLSSLVQEFVIASWLMVPIFYQDRLLGMVELHYCSTTSYHLGEDEFTLVDAIATQLGGALIQAEAYANLEDLNQQLEALDRTRSNLVAITGHELRTPLSTIQVCLESLATEPDMSPELRQVMLNTALADAERMRKLVQDFLTLSRLESGRVQWHPEALSLQECIDLALSHVRARQNSEQMQEIEILVPQDLPLVRADGEWLVEVLTKLLDNANKFTTPQGKITIQAKGNGHAMLEVTIADTGRGIEPNRLEIVFDRFYQEEGALRRTAGGTGLGLAICRQVVSAWGGKIWAESAGKDQGSEFHFTIPIASNGSFREESLYLDSNNSELIG